MTVLGTGFGIKAPVEPYFYDDFEAPALGETLWGKPGAVGANTWKMYDGGAHTDTFYTAEGYRGHGVWRVSPMNDFRDGYISGLRSTEAYVTYRYKYSHTGSWTGSYSSVNKVFRMASLEGSNPVYSGQPALMMTYQPKADWLYAQLSTDGQTTGSTTTTLPTKVLSQEGNWHRLEGYMKLSSPAGASNGEYFAGLQDVRIGETRKITRIAGSTALLDSFLLPFTSANGGEGLGDTLSQWADDVYFDNTQARIELSEKPLWDSMPQIREIQIPRVQWTDTSLQFQVNVGAFKSGQTVYLFIIDAAGCASNGWPLVIP